MFLTLIRKNRVGKVAKERKAVLSSLRGPISPLHWRGVRARELSQIKHHYLASWIPWKSTGGRLIPRSGLPAPAGTLQGVNRKVNPGFSDAVGDRFASCPHCNCWQTFSPPFLLATVVVNALHEETGGAAIFLEAAGRPANALVCHLYFPSDQTNKNHETTHLLRATS